MHAVAAEDHSRNDQKPEISGETRRERLCAGGARQDDHERPEAPRDRPCDGGWRRHGPITLSRARSGAGVGCSTDTRPCLFHSSLNAGDPKPEACAPRPREHVIPYRGWGPAPPSWRSNRRHSPAVLYLASDDGRFTTAIDLVVDGGMSQV